MEGVENVLISTYFQHLSESKTDLGESTGMNKRRGALSRLVGSEGVSQPNVTCGCCMNPYSNKPALKRYF